MAIAIRASVTVSIALETSGTRSRYLRVILVLVSASLGISSEWARQEQHIVEGQAYRGKLRCRPS